MPRLGCNAGALFSNGSPAAELSQEQKKATILSELLNTNLAVAVHEGTDKGAQSTNAAKRGLDVIIITGAAILILGFLAWRLARK